MACMTGPSWAGLPADAVLVSLREVPSEVQSEVERKGQRNSQTGLRSQGRWDITAPMTWPSWACLPAAAVLVSLREVQREVQSEV